MEPRYRERNKSHPQEFAFCFWALIFIVARLPAFNVTRPRNEKNIPLLNLVTVSAAGQLLTMASKSKFIASDEEMIARKKGRLQVND